MERERPEQEPDRSMSLELNGVRYEMNPSNTTAYIHEEEPVFDHLFHARDGGYIAIFRQQISNFDQVYGYMQEVGYVCEQAERASQRDKEMYWQTFGFPEITKRELTEREEKQIAFGKYLLDMEMITPESFTEAI